MAEAGHHHDAGPQQHPNLSPDEQRILMRSLLP